MLLDTCIMIDVLRGSTAALSFVAGLKAVPALSAVTVTELVAGCRNTKERRELERLFEHYRIHDIGRDIASLAGDYVRQYAPGHGTDPIDALIAATARSHDLPLATLNLKHFPMFHGLKRPYQA